MSAYDCISGVRTQKDLGPSMLGDVSTAPQPDWATMSLADDAIEVVVTRLNEGPEAIRSSFALLSDAERQRAGRFAFERDRRRFTVARARLRQLLAMRLGIHPESVVLNYGAYGKPALEGLSAESDLRFNVSHCDDIAVYVFATGREVGVDVEYVRVMPDADDIAARFFSRHENKTYMALARRDKPQGFFNCWTRKEAFIKALGDGLSHPLDRFDVSLSPGELARILRVDGTPGEDCEWEIHSFVPWPGFIGAIVAQKLGTGSFTRVDPEQVAMSLRRLRDSAGAINDRHQRCLETGAQWTRCVDGWQTERFVF